MDFIPIGYLNKAIAHIMDGNPDKAGEVISDAMAHYMAEFSKEILRMPAVDYPLVIAIMLIVSNEINKNSSKESQELTETFIQIYQTRGKRK